MAGPERLRFAYRAGDGAESRRLVEPYRLVSARGSRWYLVAYDLEREDWRTFRVDRVSEPFATGARFAPRELPMERGGVRPARGCGRRQTYAVEVTFAAAPAAAAGAGCGTRPSRARAASTCRLPLRERRTRRSGWRRGWR